MASIKDYDILLREKTDSELRNYFPITKTDNVMVSTDKSLTTYLKELELMHYKYDLGLKKLNNIEDLAEVNQNAYSKVKFGFKSVSAKNKTDTLSLSAGENISIDSDENDNIVISSTYHEVPMADEFQAGKMSRTDYIKLQGIESYANNYIHPKSGVVAGLYSYIRVDDKGHIIEGMNEPVPVELGGTGVKSYTELGEKLNLDALVKVDNTVTATGKNPVSGSAVYDALLSKAEKNHGLHVPDTSITTSDGITFLANNNTWQSVRTASITQSGVIRLTGNYDDVIDGRVLTPEAVRQGDAEVKSYVDKKFSDLIGGAPETLDTIYELANAAEQHAELLTRVDNAIGKKVDKVDGKGLSTNDYTTEDKNIVNNANTHMDNTTNPHNVTKTQIGLSNVTDDKQVKGLSSGTTEDNVVVFGADGYSIKDSGRTIKSNVPENAKFTDTVYTMSVGTDSNKYPFVKLIDSNGREVGFSIYGDDRLSVSKDAYGNIKIDASEIKYDEASESGSGFMSQSDYIKLKGIEEGANKYVHPTSGVVVGTYLKVSVDKYGHVISGSNEVIAVSEGGTGANNAKDALVNLGIKATATEINYLSGVTANIQDQLSYKVSTDVFSKHTHPQYSTTDHTHSYLPLSGGTVSGSINILGSTDSQPLKVRGIAGSDGEGNDGELFLQYGVNNDLRLGNTGAHSISADGSHYTGNAATATKATSATYSTSAGYSSTAECANYLTGFANRTNSITWGTLSGSDYTYITRFETADGGSIAFADKSGQTSFQVNGFIYQNEGNYLCLDTNNYKTYCTPANIGASSTAHTHSIYATTAHSHSEYSATNHTHDLSDMINTLTTETSDPVDADYYVAQYAGGGTTTTTYHRRPVSALYTYIKGKLDSVYSTSSHSHSIYSTTSHTHSQYSVTSHTHSYLPLSGGTITGQIQKAGVSSYWYSGRSNALVRTNNCDVIAYYPILSAKSADGSWDIGTYIENRLYFSYITDTNFNTETNTQTASIYFTTDGSIYATKFNGNASSATSATTSDNVSGENSTVDSDRHIWFSDSVSETKRNYSDSFKYNPATDTLTVGTLNGNISSANYATSSGYASKSSTADYATSAGMANGNFWIKEGNNIILRPNNPLYTAGIGYDIRGDECIALWAKNSVTRLRWYAGTDMSTVNTGSMMLITPDFEISKASGSPWGYIGGSIILTPKNIGNAVKLTDHFTAANGGIYIYLNGQVTSDSRFVWDGYHIEVMGDGSLHCVDNAAGPCIINNAGYKVIFEVKMTSGNSSGYTQWGYGTTAGSLPNYQNTGAYRTSYASTSSTTASQVLRYEVPNGYKFFFGCNNGYIEYIKIIDTIFESPEYAPIKVVRSGNPYAAGIEFYNSNGCLGSIAMYGSANTGLYRYNTNTSIKYLMLDTSNIQSYAIPYETDSNNIFAIKAPSGRNESYVRVPSSAGGLVPYEPGPIGSGHSYLGTESWYFSKAYIDDVYAKSYHTDNTIRYGNGGAQFFSSCASSTSGTKTVAVPIANKWYHILRMNHPDHTGYFSELAFPLTDTAATYNHMAYRVVAAGTERTWRTLLDSSNYSSYALPKSGGTLTGGLKITNSGVANGYIDLFTDGEGGTMEIASAGGTYAYHMDAVSDSIIRMYCFKRNPWTYMGEWQFDKDGNFSAKNFVESGTSLSSKYASASHTHSYLPLSGGTVSGTITFNANDSYGIRTATENYCTIGESSKYFYQSYINYMFTKGTFTSSIASGYSISLNTTTGEVLILYKKSGSTKWGVGTRNDNAFGWYHWSNGLKMTLSESGNLAVAGSTYTGSANTVTSDRRYKNTEKDLDDTLTMNFIMSLKPTSFKYNDGTSGRTHYGLIAQDVEKSMENLGMTTKDFAGLVIQKLTKETEKKTIDDNGEEYIEHIIEDSDDVKYGLRYEEFISPLIKVVQMQQKQIKELENRISSLENYS